MNNFTKRSLVIIAIFVAVGLIFIVNLFRLQVLDSEYKQFATNNILREETQYPARGLIYDRNGKLLVFNKAAYDLLITPREVNDFDTLLLCNLLDVEKAQLIERIEKAQKYSRYKPSVIVKQIPPESFAILQEQLYKFKGFHTQSRTLRDYTYPSAAHVLGYVSEVGPKDIEEDDYYRSGDYIGASGIESVYEKFLRGEKGVKKTLVDVHNRKQGSYLNGREDVTSQIGKNLTSSLDIELQLYAEYLFQNKIGSVVAIEPATGEILAMLSAPSYDPGLLVGRVRGENYSNLLADSIKPLFNRAMLAEYPPGSTFKVINTLVGLQEGAITTNTQFSCAGPESTPIRCTHFHITPLKVVDAIRESCNPFLWNTFRSIIGKYESSAEGYNVWRNSAENFGIGKNLHTDLFNEISGNLPSEAYYNNIYGKGRWNALTVRSLAIGQGELGVTPLQLANYSAIVANRGFYYIPHIIKEVEDETIDNTLRTKQYVGIANEHFEPIITGMQQLVENTNASALMRIQGITMCGKTGTAQNPHGKDHSIFMAFAPKENPQIAISVYVENSGYGATWAGPIASLIVEKYLTGTIQHSREWLEKRMTGANLLNTIQPD